MRPHHFIFNRNWYEEHGGKQDLHDYQEELSRFSINDKADLLEILSGFENRKYEAIKARIANPRVARLFRFYKELDSEVERNIWDREKFAANGQSADELIMPKTSGSRRRG